MLNRFLRYFSIGLSAMILLAGVQQGVFSKSANFVLADCAQEGGCPTIPVPAQPTPPTPQVCTPGDFKRTCTGQCGGCAADAGEAKIEHCKADGSAFEEQGGECSTECTGPCQAAPPTSEQPAPPVPAEPAAPALAASVCERKDVIGTPVEDCMGNQVCTFNIWQGPKADGSCQTGRGGAFNCRTVVGQCGVPVQAVTGTCYVCDGDTWRQAGGNPMTAEQCARIDNALFNQPNKPSWCQASQQQPAPARPAPAAPGATATGGSASATGGSSSATGGSSTVTINNPAVTTREVVRETTRVVTAGNVGIGTTLVIQPAVQGVQVTQLPKTGLPALAWSALAFIPAGFGMRRFSKVKKDLEKHPSYIFEERQSKDEV